MCLAIPALNALVHTGYAINILDQEEAEETLMLFREIAGLAEEEG